MASPDEPDLTAAELALGVLDGEERAAALRRSLADPAFAREVERWRRHFTALYAEVMPVEPEPAVERRVLAIAGRGRESAGRWRVATALMGIAAAVLLAIVLVRPGAPPAAPPIAHHPPLLVAALKQQHGEPVAAVFDPAARAVTLRGTIATPDGRSAELWAIGADGVPHAAGLIGSRGTRVAIGRDLAVGAGVTLAISIEPLGGSPKSTPTGPVVASGALAAI